MGEGVERTESGEPEAPPKPIAELIELLPGLGRGRGGGAAL